MVAARVMASSEPGLRIWQVGALCRALADALDARFNPVTVQGEISGFSRAASGHCYFALKDASGQLRCVMSNAPVVCWPSRRPMALWLR